MAHVRRGDTVVVVKGRERGKRGKVKRILKNGRVEIEKVMMVRRHSKPTQKNPQGGIMDIEGRSRFPMSRSGVRSAPNRVARGLHSTSRATRAGSASAVAGRSPPRECR